MVEIGISKIYMEKQKHMQITKKPDNTENGNWANWKFWSRKFEGDVENTQNQDINIGGKYMGFMKMLCI